jgi:selenide,water dikinase
VLFNANLKKWVSAEAMQACLSAITTLNRAAAEALQAFKVHAATDITGFGLAGHAFEMASGSNVCLELEVNALPIMAEALDMYKKGMTTGVNRLNRQMVAKHARLDAGIEPWHEEILYDPQTSGGLLVALPESEGRAALAALKKRGVSDACIIGRVTPCQGKIRLVFR